MAKIPTRAELSHHITDIYLTLKTLMARLEPVAHAELDRNVQKSLKEMKRKSGPHKMFV